MIVFNWSTPVPLLIPPEFSRELILDTFDARSDVTVLMRALFDAKSPLTVVMRELLSDNEDVKELMSVSIVIMLWFNEPMFEEWVLIAVASCAVFDWRALILLEFPLILICRAEVVSVCARTSVI